MPSPKTGDEPTQLDTSGLGRGGGLGFEARLRPGTYSYIRLANVKSKLTPVLYWPTGCAYYLA